MKIMDWIHRKFLQSYTQAKEKDEDYEHSNHPSLVDILELDRFSRFKSYNSHEGSKSGLKLVQNGAKINEGQDCYSAGEMKRNQSSRHKNVSSDVSVHGKDLSTSNTHPDGMEVEGVDEWRKVVEKILRMKSCMEEANVSGVKKSERGETAVHEDKIESRRRKSKNGRRVFPLREFLDIPHDSPAELSISPHVKEKKKKKKMGGFSNLFDIRKLACGLYEKDGVDREDGSDQKPWLLHKSDQNPSNRSGVTCELLRRKAASTSSDSAHPHHHGEQCCGGGKGGERHGMLGCIADGESQTVGSDDCYDETCEIVVEAFKFDMVEGGGCNEECGSWGSYSLTRNKEYGHWIRSDEEYVVLEL